MLFRARAGLPLPCIFHLSTFFRSLQILRFAKIYPFPKCGQTVYNQVKREEEGFPENNEKKEREKTMEKMLLHENWKLRDASETEWIPGTVSRQRLSGLPERGEDGGSLLARQRGAGRWS